MDNFHIDVTSEGREAFSLAMQLAFDGDPIRSRKAVAFKSSKDRLVLYWTHDERDTSGLAPDGSSAPVKLPFAMSAAQAAEFVWGWLGGAADYGAEPDHDGSNSEGWRVFCGDWGHVDGDLAYARRDRARLGDVRQMNELQQEPSHLVTIWSHTGGAAIGYRGSTKRHPIEPRTFVLMIDLEDNRSMAVVDDGDGRLVGDSRGRIDYRAGAYIIRPDNPLKSTKGTVTYNFEPTPVRAWWMRSSAVLRSFLARARAAYARISA